MARKRKTAAEKRQEEAIALEARLHEALRWTGPVSGPDIQRPTYASLPYPAHVSGWTVNTWNWSVGPAWTKGGSHRIGEAHPTGDGGSQNSIPLYSTPELALRDLRRQIERWAASKMEGIDRELAEIEQRRARDTILTSEG